MRGTKPSLRTDSKAITAVPRAPAWLSPAARLEWRRVMPLLVERKILTDADMAMVEAFCVASVRVREIEKLIQNPSGEIDGKLFRMQGQAMQTARQIAAELGLTPVSRSRPTIRDDDQQDDGWDL